MANKISVFRGDNPIYSFRFEDKDGVAVDITGWTVFFTVKTEYADDDVGVETVISKTVTSHTAPTDGLTELQLSTSDTDLDSSVRYLFDIQIKRPNAPSVDLVNTLVVGEFEVKQDVTRRTS